jgi:hypothetical protein
MKLRSGCCCSGTFGGSLASLGYRTLAHTNLIPTRTLESSLSKDERNLRMLLQLGEKTQKLKTKKKKPPPFLRNTRGERMPAAGANVAWRPHLRLLRCPRLLVLVNAFCPVCIYPAQTLHWAAEKTKRETNMNCLRVRVRDIPRKMFR